MSRWLTDPFAAPFMQRALIEAMLLGAFGGVLGVYVVLRRLAFLSEAMTHTVFPGIAVAFVLDASLFWGALVAGTLSAVVLTLFTRSRRVTDDAALAVVLTAFFAIGVAVVSRQRTFTTDLTALLFGRILEVDTVEILQTVAVMVVVLTAVAMLHKELVLRAFDESAAVAAGYRVGVLDLVLDVTVTLFVVAAARAVGTVLVVALLVTPAATARLLCRRVSSMIVVSAVVGVAAGWAGLVVSFDASVRAGVRLAPGATIVLALTVLFAVALGLAATRSMFDRRRALAEAP